MATLFPNTILSNPTQFIGTILNGDRKTAARSGEGSRFGEFRFIASPIATLFTSNRPMDLSGRSTFCSIELLERVQDSGGWYSHRSEVPNVSESCSIGSTTVEDLISPFECCSCCAIGPCK